MKANHHFRIPDESCPKTKRTSTNKNSSKRPMRIDKNLSASCRPAPTKSASMLFGKCYRNSLMFFRFFDVSSWLREISPSNPWFHIQMFWKTCVFFCRLDFTNFEDLCRTKGSLRTCFPRISDHAEISVRVIVTCNVVVWLIQHHIYVLFDRVHHLQQEKMHDLSLNAGCQSV